MSTGSQGIAEKIASLVGDRRRRLQFGLLAGVVMLVFLLLPVSEDYSSDGFTDIGGVSVKCGSLINRDVTAEFDSYDEQLVWDNFSEGQIDPDYPEDVLYVFEGQSASQVCDESLGENRNIAVVAAVAGVLLVASSRLGRPKS